MAVSVKPTDLFASWSENGTDITVPIASITGLTAAEADAVTGDYREIERTICEKAFQLHYTTAAADRPAGVTWARNGPQSDQDGILTTVYQVTFKTTISDQTLISPT